MLQHRQSGPQAAPRAGFFVKPAYRTKSGKRQLAIYFQPAAVTGPSSELAMPPTKPLLIAANAFNDPETFLGVVAKALNIAIAN